MKREKKIVLYSSLVSLLLLLSYVSNIYVITGEKENKDLFTDAISPYSTFSLPKDIVFNYSDTFTIYTYSVELDLSLDGLYELQISFQTDGEIALRDSLRIELTIGDNASTVFVIDQFYQDKEIHNLTRSFLAEHIKGTANISLRFEGESFYGEEGSLTLFRDLILFPHEIPELQNEVISPVIIPSELFFSGRAFGEKKVYAFSFFEFNVENLSLIKINFSFTTNEFNSIENKITFSIGANEVEKDFNTGSNTIIVSLTPVLGLNVLNISFTVGYSADVVKLQNFVLTMKTEEKKEENQFILFSEEWEGDTIDISFDLSLLKPTFNSKEAILNLSLVCGFEGSAITPYVEVSLISGIYTIYEGKIMSYDQLTEKTLEIYTFTYTYNKALLLEFHAKLTQSGTGKIILYNSTKLSVSSIPRMSSQGLIRTLEKEKSFLTPSEGVVITNYYDVFYCDYSTITDYSLNLSCFLESNFEDIFDRLSITVKIGVNATAGEIFYEPGELAIIENIKIYQGYNEVKIQISVYGTGTFVTLKNLQYILLPLDSSSDSSSNNQSTLNPSNIPLIKAPYTISLGISSLFGQWVIGGIFVKVFFNKKKKEKFSKESKYKLEL